MFFTSCILFECRFLQLTICFSMPLSSVQSFSISICALINDSWILSIHVILHFRCICNCMRHMSRLVLVLVIVNQTFIRFIDGNALELWSTTIDVNHYSSNYHYNTGVQSQHIPSVSMLKIIPVQNIVTSVRRISQSNVKNKTSSTDKSNRNSNTVSVPFLSNSDYILQAVMNTNRSSKCIIPSFVIRCCSFVSMI